MKKVVYVTIGRKEFNLEADAFLALREYLDIFRYKSSAGQQSDETMQDLEERIAEILYSKTSSVRNVVTIDMIDEITGQMGLPDGKVYRREGQTMSQPSSEEVPVKTLYRDKDNKILGGVSSGLGCYFGVDPAIVRIIFILMVLAGMSGILVYIVLWIVVPEAKTSVQKCEMRGWAITAENIERVTRNS